jgi:CheY-like chemotaxis protein
LGKNDFYHVNLILKWACGVILYEFLYGIPPFNAATPHLVFENILIHRIDWLEEELHISIEARELMENLMCHDMEKRIGTKSSEEVKNMAWFQGTDWDHLSNQKVFFSPTVKNIEDTDYFDARGVQNPDGLSDSDESVDNGTGTEASIPEDDDGTDFGGAVMKNLPLLEKANQKTMNKINQEFPEGEAWMQKRRDSLPLMTLPFGSNPHSPSLSSPIGGPLRSVSPLHLQSMTRRDSLPLNPAGPASPTKLSPKKVNRLLASASLETMWQKPLDYSTVNNAPSLNTINNIMSQGSLSLIKDEDDFMSRKRSQAYLDIAKQNLINQTTLETPITSPFQSIANAVKSSSDHALNLTSHETSFSPPFLDVLIAESNPAAALVLENILQTAGCRCVQVKSGAEVIQCAMGEIKFGIIFCDINLPVSMFFLSY